MLSQNNFFHKQFSTIVLLVISIFTVNAQTTKQSLKIYICNSEFPTASIQYLKKSGIPKVHIFDQRYLDPDNDQQLNTEFLKQAVLNEIPNSKDTGLAVLDWEGDSFVTLYKARANSDSFKLVLNEYQKALMLCQKLRPKMKWGFYYLPFTDYWLNDTSALQEVNKKLFSLMMKSNILFPSMYNHYPDGTKSTHNDYYIDYNVKQILKIGAALKKKVILFVSHRWHEGNQYVGSKLIPENEFYSSLKNMIDIKINIKRIDGFIWFSADTYYFKLKPSLLTAENPLNKSVNDHYDDILMKYTDIFLKIKSYYSKL